MAGQSSAGLQISGHRFLRRRTAHALVRGDVRMLDDPLRGQSRSFTAGGVLAVIVVAVCCVLAVLQPRATLGDAPIVLVRDTGALYVRIGDTVHPVLNLASARLVAGNPATPQLVSPSALRGVVTGATVGIPGAPDAVATPLSDDESGWTLCDDATSTTTLLAGVPRSVAASQRGALVVARGEGAAATYLLFDGQRARVDLRDPAVVRALKLEGIAPRPISPVLLDAVPEVPEITAPVVRRPGTAGPSTVHGLAVGTVVRLVRAESSDFYVVLADGVQRISEVTADLIRFGRSGGDRDIVTVEPGAIGSVPVVDELPVAAFPDRAGVSDEPVLCAGWRWPADARAAETTVFTADKVPVGVGTSVALAQGDGAGTAIDKVVFPAGRSAYVRAAGVSGDGAETGALYLVSDAGVVFGVHDSAAAERLGLTGGPVPAPWPLLAHLPRGPELSVEAASVVRDAVAPPP